MCAESKFVIPNDPRELLLECESRLRELGGIEGRRKQILSEVPRLVRFYAVQTAQIMLKEDIGLTDEEIAEKEQFINENWVDEDSLSEAERLADSHFRELKRREHTLLKELRLIRIQAKFLGIELPAQAQYEKMAQKRRKRASPDHVTSRRSIVWATWRSNPGAIGNDLDLLTCRALDHQEVPVPEKWEIDNWEAGYKHHPQVRQLIHKMFSGDRKSVSSE